MSDVSLKLRLLADDASMRKALDRAAKDLDRTGKKAKKTSTEVKGLGHSFTQAANNVAIFNGQLDPISGRLSAIGTGIKRFGIANIAMGVGITTVGYSVTQLVGALETYEARQNKFEGLLRATGNAARLTKDDLESLAQTTARSTLGDVAGTSEAINALLTFRKVQGEVFKETIRLAVDAKVVFGGNLREGVVAFGKALNDPIANLGALSRKGIQFTDAQKEMIELMWETGDAAGAQNVILAEMRNQFGGLGNIEAPALTAATDSLDQSWDNFLETLGRTGVVVLARNVVTGLVMATDDLLQLTTSFHDKNKAEFEEINRLQAVQLASAEKLNKAKKLHNELVAAGGTRLEATAVAASQAEYDAATKNLQNFINEKKKVQELARIADARGVVRTLVGELDETTSKNKEIIKSYDQRRISLISGFEDEKDKANRIHEQKTKDIEAAYDKQVISQDSLVKKEQELFDKSKKANELFYNEKIRRIRVADGDNDKILKAQSDLNEKNEELVKHHNEFMNEQNDEELIAEIQHGDTLVAAKEGLDKKLSDIDKRAAARTKADELRKERALKVAAAASRKRAKFLAEIEGGGGKVVNLGLKYKENFDKLAEHEKDKTFLSEKSADERAAIFDGYRLKLAESYQKDVDKFTEAENSKTLRLREQAAKRAGREFKDAAKLGAADIEGSAGGLQDFFGVNIGENQAKQEELLALKQKSLEDIDALEVADSEKKARREEINKQFGIKQQELEKQGKVKAYGDMQNAIAALGASGSKKLFALNKAMRISQAVMSTYQAATNAFAEVPYPFNIAASALIVAGGLANVSKIKNERMPQFHDGITNNPREGSFLIAEGERVVGAQLNQDLTEDLRRRRQNQDNGGGQPIINLTLPDTGNYSAVEQWYEDNSDRIVAHVRYAMNRP